MRTCARVLTCKIRDGLADGVVMMCVCIYHCSSHGGKTGGLYSVGICIARDVMYGYVTSVEYLKIPCNVMKLLQEPVVLDSATNVKSNTSTYNRYSVEDRHDP